MRAVFLVLVLAVLLFFIGLLIAHDMQGMPRVEWALDWTRRVLGILIIVVAAAGILFLGIAGDSLKRQADLVLPLLAGLALHGMHWTVVIAVGVVGVALIAKEALGPPSFPRSEGPRDTGFRP